MTRIVRCTHPHPRNVSTCVSCDVFNALESLRVAVEQRDMAAMPLFAATQKATRA